MKRLIILAALVAALGISNIPLHANNPAPDPPPAKEKAKKADPTQDPGIRKLSKRERKDAIAKLSDKYRAFLEEVEPIMIPRELDAFLTLETDEQRDLFIEDFWARRDPKGPRGHNLFRDEYLARISEAKDMFKYLSSDRSRIYLTQGRPDDRLITECDDLLQPLEIWYYGYLPQLGHNVRLLFYRVRGSHDYRLWIPMGVRDDLLSLGELVSDRIVATKGQEEGARYVFIEPEFPGSRFTRVETHCKDGREILSAIGAARLDNFRIPKLFDPPEIDDEDVGKLLRASVLSTPGATALPAEFSVKYPGKRGGMTAVDMTILIDPASLQVKDINGSRFFNVDVVGEVIKDGKLFESYRYKYDFPADEGKVPERLPVSVERFLRPANYRSRIKVADVNSGAEAILENDLAVPPIQDDPAIVAKRIEGESEVRKLAESFKGQSRLRIVPLPNDLLTGLQHIDTIVSGGEINSVDFYLDGKRVMTKRAPPYSLDLDLGTVPQPRTIKAVGKDEDDQIVGGDEVMVNVGQDPFRVRIVSPRVAVDVKGPVRVEMAVDVPEGKKLDNVELYLNETRLATLYSPPFIQTVRIPADLGIAYFRAVAKLKEKTQQEAEDVVFINSPEFLQQVNVHLIELPTTVLRNGRPISDLEQKDFTVLDEGKRVELSKFEYVQNLPLSIGMAIDSSGSMKDRMAYAQKAGAEFFESVLKPGDQAFLVSFDAQPLQLQKWTKKLADLNAGLASLRAEEATALYDAIVFSLYRFQNVRGQKALIVITDGKDTASQFSFDQAIEYAKRAAVPIYGIGIGIRATEVDTRYKFGKFASETGGAIHYIDQMSDLPKVYGEIEQELRAQYMLSFYPPAEVAGSGKWREVEVKVGEGRAKTIRGYYP